jgi:hypothetical protein
MTITRTTAGIAVGVLAGFVLAIPAVGQPTAAEQPTPQQEYVAAIRAFEFMQASYGIEVGDDADAEIAARGRDLCDQGQPAELADAILAAQYLCQHRLPALQSRLDLELAEAAYEPCASEDSDGPCLWNAAIRGNGIGASFVRNADGTIDYL